MTKHETFYVSITTDENGYHVTRQKHFMGKYHPAILLDMKECMDAWIAKFKPNEEMDVEIIGNGTDYNFHQTSIIRFIKHRWSDAGFKVIWFGDAVMGDAQEFSTKKEAVAYFNQQYKKVADHIAY